MLVLVVRGGGGGCGGGESGRGEGERWYEAAGGLEQSGAVEVAIGEAEDQSTSDGALDVIAEPLQGLQ